MTYKYNPAKMLELRITHGDLITKSLNSLINKLVKHGAEINQDDVRIDDIELLLASEIAIRDNDKIIFNPEIFVF